MTALISTRQLTKRFGDLVAVDAVDLDVGPGEVVGLLGANGAGKTTLIRMILGLERPTTGSVTLLGEPPSRAGRARLGYVPQGLGLYDDLTVTENLEFVARAFGTGVPTLDPELSRIADTPVGAISLGFKRRVAFVAALSHHPDVLLLDEPTSGVGPLGRAELWDAIGTAAGSGTGVLVSTHYMEEAEQCDRLLMLAAGRAVAQGSTTELTASVTAVEVVTTSWREALDAVGSAGMRASVTGTTLRVIDVEMSSVEAALKAANLDARVRRVPASFDEAFVALATA